MSYKRPRLLSREEMEAMLPNVGDIRMERPTIDESTTPKGAFRETPARRCVVEEVHREHLWYRVRFENTGLCECYIVPAVKKPPGGRDVCQKTR